MKRLAFIALAGILASALPALALDPAATFADANKAYSAGEYAKARDGYEALVRQGDYGAGVFYNLADAAWRMGDAGAAALNFQRALALQNGLPEAAENLKLVREKSGAKFFAPSRWDVLFPVATPNLWIIAGTVAAWHFLFALVAFLLRTARAANGWLGVCALFLAAYCAAGWARAERRWDRAIVVARSAEARFAPLDNSPLADTLPAASEVRVLQSGGAWSYCLVPTKTRAWIPSIALAPLRPAGS